MKKEEIIARYGEEEYKRRIKRNTKEGIIAHDGEEGYKKRLKQNSDWRKSHLKEAAQGAKRWRKRQPEKVKQNNQRLGKEYRKGGKYYEYKQDYQRAGIQYKRNLIRGRHYREFSELKRSLAQEVHIHHEWIDDTAEYRGMALVEAKAHWHGYIDVILLLDGEITIYDFT